jgi:DNA primase
LALNPRGRDERDRILEATDLVALVGEHLRLVPKGREHVGLCPFHDDRRPSFSVISHKGIPFFNCFACGAAGNAIDFMMRYHRIDYGQALRQLAERAGIALVPWRGEGGGDSDERPRLLKANEIASRFYRRFLADETLGHAARAMLGRRGVSERSQEQFGVGCAPEGWDHLATAVERHLDAAGGRERDPSSPLPDLETFSMAGLIRRSSRGGWIDAFRNRLIIPIRNEMGRPIAFGGRQIAAEDEPKYLNSPESPVFDKSSTLFALDLAKQSIIRRRTAVVVEGYLDAIACHAAGFDHVVATLGTSLTAGHARLLRHKAESVILLFDGDEAGQRAADRAVEVFLAGTLDVRIAVLPGGLDPDDLLREEDGAARLGAALEGATDSLEYLLRRFRSRWSSLDSLSGRQQAMEGLLGRLVELGLDRMPPLRRGLVLQSLSHLSGLPVGELLAVVRSRRARGPAIAGPGGGEEPSIEIDAAAVPVPPARRVAERTLLSVLLAYPHLVANPAVRERLDRGLRDPLATAAAAWLEETSAGVASATVATPILSDLLTAVPEALRRELDGLLELAEARPRLESNAEEQLHQAIEDLDRLDRHEAIELERLDEPPAADAVEASRRLERLRAGGGRAAAIGRINRPA